MTYATFIGQLRTQVGDTRRRVHVDWTANGTDTVFQMPDDTFPVYDDASTYTVKVAGVTKTETTDYTLDKETGTLTLNSPPTNGQAVTIDCSAVYLQDATWLDIVNNVIKSLGDDFWKEFVDETNFTTTANMLSLSLVASQPNCIAVYDFWHRKNTSENWVTVETYSNWRFDRENNKIYLSDRTAFTVAAELLKVRGLKTYTLGTTISATIDVQDRFLTILEYGSIARYWRYRYKSVVELVSKMSTEQTRTPLQELIMLSDRFDRAYEQEKAKLKPAKPPRVIPSHIEGGGRP
jgi:hypothetical protein